MMAIKHHDGIKFTGDGGGGVGGGYSEERHLKNVKLKKMSI